MSTNSLIPGARLALKNCGIIKKDITDERDLILSVLQGAKFFDPQELHRVEAGYNEKIAQIADQETDLKAYLEKLEAQG